MRLQDLTPEQLEKLSKAMASRLNFIRKLIDRMEANHWPAHDQFYRDLEIVERLLRDAVQQVQSEWSFRR